MQHALGTPLGRMIVVAGLGLALTAAVRTTRPHKHKLALHTEWRADALYLSAWNRGGEPIAVDLDTRHLKPMTFTITADVSDGCRWQATERLVPIGSHRYSYHYDETILSCEDGAQPFAKTPRTGCVTVDE